MLHQFKKRLKRTLQGARKRIRLAYRTWVNGFTGEGFRSALEQIGVRTGDVLMVHSSFNRFEGFRGNAIDVIHLLQQAVGPQGVLMMPTMPFDGLAVDYAATGPCFDVNRSPSRMGILTELFRRSPGVRRSLHPTHPVAAWGERAEAMLADHVLARTPCGAGTPWARLLDQQGKILFLGTDIGSMTFFHVFDERLETQMPFSVFTAEEFVLPTRDEHGVIHESRLRLFHPAMSRRRNLTKFVPVLQQRGAWHTVRIGQLRMLLLAAIEVEAAILQLAASGVYGYDLPTNWKMVGNRPF